MKRRDKDIRYTVYAKDRMRSRSPTLDQVRQVIMEPDAIRPADKPDRKRYEKQMSKRKKIIVIAKERSREFEVITAWQN